MRPRSEARPSGLGCADPWATESRREGMQTANDRPNTRRMAHCTNSPNFTGKLPESAPDLDTEIIQHMSTNCAVVDPIGNTYDVELGQQYLGIDGQLEIERVETCRQGPMRSMMPGKCVFEALLLEQVQCCMQRVYRVYRRGMMIGPSACLALPVAAEQGKIEKPARNWTRAGTHRIDGALGNCQRREPGRGRQAFLRACVVGVDLPVVDAHIDATQGRHPIDDGKCAEFSGDRGQLCDLRSDTRRSFSVDPGDRGDPVLGDGIAQMTAEPVGIHLAAPGKLEQIDLGPATATDLGHAPTKHPILTDDESLSGFDEVDDARLHGCRSRSGKRHCERALRAKHPAKLGLGVFHHSTKLGVEMAQGRIAHGRDHPWIDVGRPGTHQAALRGR